METKLILPRRTFLAGLGFIAAAPAIVKAASLMPIKAYHENFISFQGWGSLPLDFDDPSTVSLHHGMELWAQNVDGRMTVAFNPFPEPMKMVLKLNDGSTLIFLCPEGHTSIPISGSIQELCHPHFL